MSQLKEAAAMGKPITEPPITLPPDTLIQMKMQEEQAKMQMRR
jgi:hypothetical protein